MASLTVFLISVAFCAYTLFGYPLLLALVARFRHRAVRKGPMRASETVLRVLIDTLGE